MPVVSAEDGIVEFIEELCLHIGLFHDDTTIRLRGDNLAAELTISSNINKQHFGIECCQGHDNSLLLLNGFSTVDNATDSLYGSKFVILCTDTQSRNYT